MKTKTLQEEMYKKLEQIYKQYKNVLPLEELQLVISTSTFELTVTYPRKNINDFTI